MFNRLFCIHDDELRHKPIHTRTSYIHFTCGRFPRRNKEKITIKKLNVACGRRVSYVLVKLMLQQSLSLPFYIVKQKITRSLECFYMHLSAYPRSCLYSNQSVEIANKPLDWIGLELPTH